MSTSSFGGTYKHDPDQINPSNAEDVIFDEWMIGADTGKWHRIQVVRNLMKGITLYSDGLEVATVQDCVRLRSDP